jgi:RNA polymerase sigma factor FliA
MIPNPQTLIEDCQGLVRSLASRIHHKMPAHVVLDDLVAYGQVGLAEAARDFDPARGIQFSTFAYYRIRGAIYDGLAKMSWFSRVEYGRRKQQLSGQVLSWREAEDNASGLASLVDTSTPAPPAVAILHEINTRLDELATALPEDARELIHTIYSEGLDLQEAGRRLAISKSWASRLHRRTLRRLAGDRRLAAML